LPHIATTSTKGGDMRTLAGLRVLVLEDSPVIETDLETLLREFGCDVIGPFGDPAGALAALRTEKPQAAVLDIIHRGHHTFELADALAPAQVPFVFLSGHSSDILPDRHRERPFVDKPFRVRPSALRLQNFASGKD
jgi:CheY-like chemotaxis protein